MAARKKQKQASNPYNLRNKLEIPVELQIESDDAFLNELSRSGSISRSDTDSDIESLADTLVSRGSTDTDDTSPVSKHSHHFKTSRKTLRGKGKVKSDPRSEVQPDQTLINQRILSQLDAIGKRLSVIESSASVASSKVKKSSSVCGSTTASSSLPSSSKEDTMHAKLPDLHTIRHDKLVQEQVEERIRQLSNSDKKGTDPRIKSQRGGSVDIYVKEKVKWPHEYVLAGNTKDRISYNQLNITQFMSGFCRIMREESCQVTKDHMLDYLISLLDDSNDFLWQAAKANHAMLLCRMEQGEVTSWSQTDKIDRIRRANAQKHLPQSQTVHSNQKFRKSGSGQKSQKSMPCVFFNDNSCNFSKHHETKGVFYRHICSSCFAQDGKIGTHSALDCKQKSKND